LNVTKTSKLWDYYGMKIPVSVTVNNIQCNLSSLGYIYPSGRDSIVLNCKTTNNPVSASSYTFYFPTIFLRDDVTKKLYNYTFVDNIRIPYGYVIEYYISIVNITYFVNLKKIRVRFNLTIDPVWEGNYNNSNISVNNILINTTNITLVFNP
jgi:hypothetical protein